MPALLSTAGGAAAGAAGGGKAAADASGSPSVVLSWLTAAVSWSMVMEPDAAVPGPL